MKRFHPLKVTEVRRETRDSVVLAPVPRDDERALFDFVQGQYLTFRRSFDGEELRRSYSICSGADEHCLRVGIKRVDGGGFSTWANEDLGSGLVVVHSQNRTIAARRMAEKKVCGQRSYRVAMRRQSFNRPNMISMRLRRL